MDALDDNQRRALSQLREITQGTDEEVAISVLSSVGWDVQKAAELIFGTETNTQTSVMKRFEFDDSQQGEDLQPQTSSSYTLIRPLLSFLTFPLHVLSSLFRFVFGILRIPIPQLPFIGVNFYRPLRPRPTVRGGPDRWVRELEEETGAISIGRSKLPRGTTSSLNMEPGQSSSLVSRAPGMSYPPEDGRKYLPDFTISPYEDVLQMCQKDAKIGCIILVSEEHDDAAEFKRSTLTDFRFVKTLYENDIIVWGGDVKDREAWNAAEKLQATTYPFVAFIALQPRRNPAASSSSRTTSPPALTVLSRHQGKSYPASGPTSAQTLVDHLERQLLPRVTPFLNRIASANREREHDRRLREEQDRAFQDTAKRDKERIEAKMATERAEREARRMAEEEARLAEQRRAREAESARQRQIKRMDWRRWTRRQIVNTQSDNAKADSLRIAIRLPHGGRVVQSFPQSASLTSLFAFIDTQFIPLECPASDDPVSLPGQKGTGESALENYILNQQDQYWGFRVALAYPRVEIPWKQGQRLSDISHLKGGGQVVVESIIGERSFVNENGGNDDDDGYHTEDSE
ncbi:hypothetical protein CPB84DRAFT_1679978 [Gymnopilus junonius]|uniref:UBX domain-containing protein n=1 Tax=Gymnopilus junonius TaxID=109634 RepID=A0A9P5NPW1_GYMJU|nr:hypothetical protein CPB84DRAFT_1679978 [Gymnopilus junonius]